jgi:hypothetical protein
VGVQPWVFPSFTNSDPFAYWDSLNLNVEANRIKVVKVDGGAGKPSDATGSDETTLDIEQAGGIAPGAKVIVYEAPNTDQALRCVCPCSGGQPGRFHFHQLRRMGILRQQHRGV